MREGHERQESTAGPRPMRSGQSEALPDLLRRSLRDVLADARYKYSDEAELRVTLRDVCTQARRDGIRAEHLLIVLKESWRELPERARLPRYAADQTLARLVSACINEYYQDRTVRGPDSPSRCIEEADRMHALQSHAELQ